jgi:Prp8 binding protein
MSHCINDSLPPQLTFMYRSHAQVWDLRQNDEPSLVMRGHSDTVTGLRTSPDGSHLLSNSMDNTLRVWDMRPYAPQNRCVKVFTGVWEMI